MGRERQEWPGAQHGAVPDVGSLHPLSHVTQPSGRDPEVYCPVIGPMITGERVPGLQPPKAVYLQFSHSAERQVAKKTGVLTGRKSGCWESESNGSCYGALSLCPHGRCAHSGHGIQLSAL